MHPENVGGLFGHGGGFQLGPVLVPAGDLHLDDDVGVLFRVGVAHGLHTVALGDVPNLERQMGLAIARTAAAGGQACCRQRGCSRKERTARNLLHKPSPLNLPMGDRVPAREGALGESLFRHYDGIVNRKLCVVHIAQFLLPCCAIIIHCIGWFLNAIMPLFICQFLG